MARQAEVVFLPGRQRLSIRQRFSGIDQHAHLVLHTHLEGRLPAVPPGSSVQMGPYQEVYHHQRNRERSRPPARLARDET